MTDDRQEKDELLRQYREGTSVELERDSNGSSVLSVRLSREVLRELTRVAQREGRPVGRLARELIEAGLAAREDASGIYVLKAAERVIQERIGGLSSNIAIAGDPTDLSKLRIMVAGTVKVNPPDLYRDLLVLSDEERPSRSHQTRARSLSWNRRHVQA